MLIKSAFLGFAVSFAPLSAFAQDMASSSTTVSAVPEQTLNVPKSGTITVAFVVSDHSNLIDLAGPMQTFHQVTVPNGGFKTFTVSEKRDPVHVQGLVATPDYTFDDAPDADIVVIGAQPGGDKYTDYLRRMNARGKLMLSVCTGVGHFALSGILDGLTATTHHNYVQQFENDFPKVHWLADKAWVHSAPMIYTAGGETSGFELALHIVELYYGRKVAVETARSMEYRGPTWQS